MAVSLPKVLAMLAVIKKHRLRYYRGASGVHHRFTDGLD